MRHIITGGSGFTGTYLVSALVSHGEKPVIFDCEEPRTPHGSVDFIRGDIREYRDIAKLNLDADDIVYHLAARQFHAGVPRQNRDKWFADVNVGGTRSLLKAMAAGASRRLIFFSTDMTYGIPDNTPVSPEHAQRPIGPYGRSKLEAERLMTQAGQEFGLKASIFRPRLISGAGRLGILTKLFRLIRAGLPVPLIGAGKNRYQLIAVEDCVAAALAAVQRDCPAGPFNLGSDNPPTVRELLSELIRRAGSRSFLVSTPAEVLQPTLAFLDWIGLTLLYPEQFAIANIDYILDTTTTTTCLDWKPLRNDIDIIYDAYSEFTKLANTES